MKEIKIAIIKRFSQARHREKKPSFNTCYGLEGIGCCLGYFTNKINGRKWSSGRPHFQQQFFGYYTMRLDHVQ